MIEVKKRSWREKREGDKWSSVHTGLHVEKYNILISKLSHGLRVIEIANPEDYQFTETSKATIQVTTNFVTEAMAALSADKRLQKQLNEYEAVMK